MRLLSSIIKSTQVKAGKRIVVDNQNDIKKKREIIEASSNEEGDNKQLKIKKEKLLKESQVKAEEIIKKAEDEAEAILSQAQNKAKEIRVQAKNSIEASQNKAREEGYQQGFDQGRDAGIKEGLAQLTLLINDFKVKSVQIQQEIEGINKQLPDKIVELAIVISKKIINKELTLDPTVIKSSINNTLKLLDGEETIKIRVNPDSLDILKEYKKELLSSNDLENIKFIADQSIDGGCVIETNCGGFDATIESQLTEIEAKLMEVTNNA